MEQIIADGPYLDDEEREMMESFNRGEWHPLEGQELADMQAKLKEAARTTLAELETKSERMNIRMTPGDMAALKAAAAREGLPYQSLVTSVLHKYVSGTLVDVAEARKVLASA
jgi:predicted DNA binding CopG/RHH family protein